MTLSQYLFHIDTAPVDLKLIDYFSKFNYQFIALTKPEQLSTYTNTPLAILIHADFIKTNPEIINHLYHQYKAPLIVVGEQRDEAVFISALEQGADDFLLKPIHPRELHARIAAISRRVARSMQEVTQEKDVFHFADWRLYPGSHQLFNKENQELSLSSGEYDLLLTFIKHPQQILSRDYLLQVLKNTDFHNLDRRIDVQISRLRQKIEQDSKKPCLIKTIRNGGYLFTPQVLLTKEELPHDAF